jgi:hypothetical protein
MSVLTENVVLSRTRSQDLRSVKKLNCWGSELSDVSIVRRLPNVEVLSLSINNITTLTDFASCRMLQELYLRKNKINDINELLYLIELPDLKKLWLAENPCAEFDNYRMTVLKALPNLEYLDNIRVTPEEVIRAEREGFDIIWPQSDNEENEELNQQIISTQESQLAAVVPTLPQSSTQTYQQQPQPSQQELQQQMLITGNNSYHSSPNSYNSANSSPLETTPQLNKRSQMIKSNSLSDYNLYNGNTLPTPSSATYDPPQPLFQYPCDANASGYTASAYQNTPTISSSRINSASNGNLSQHSQRLLPKGGKNRNANILSAVLCLIKELDYASLEVVDTTIHCRMEEMED